jgi:carboxymethylenebutenolidase
MLFTGNIVPFKVEVSRNGAKEQRAQRKHRGRDWTMVTLRSKIGSNFEGESQAMIDEHEDQTTNEPLSTEITRRNFATLLVGAGLAATVSAVTIAGAEVAIVETEVEVKTPDGVCDAAFFHPKNGKHPGILFWTDAFGLRPSMREMGRRLAAEGYSVLIPNPYYRTGKTPFTDASTVNFEDPSLMTKLTPLRAPLNVPGNVEKDAAAYVAFIDAQKQVNKSKKIGTQGYCMGGALVMKTAASLPNRIGAGASFHGGGLVTDKPDSPHLLAPKIKAQMYFGVAANDDERQPDAKTKLKEAFAAAKVSAEIEVYPAKHGWCVRDMPLEKGAPIYDPAQAERAWAKLVSLYKTALK